MCVYVCEIFPQEHDFFKTQRKLGYVTKSRQTNKSLQFNLGICSFTMCPHIYPNVKHHNVTKFKLSLRRGSTHKRQANENVIPSTQLKMWSRKMLLHLWRTPFKHFNNNICDLRVYNTMTVSVSVSVRVRRFVRECELRQQRKQQ